MAFVNPFSSVSTFVNQVKNVGNVLSIALNPFSKDKVAATTSNKTVNAAINAVTNNPYTTAGLIATSVSTAAKTAITTAISKLSPLVKVAAGTGTIATSGLIVGNPKLVAPVINTISSFAPEQIVKFSTQIGSSTASTNASSLKDTLIATAKSNPALSIAIAAGTAYVGGKTLNTINNFISTAETRTNNKLLEENNNLMKNTIPDTAPQVSFLTQDPKPVTIKEDVKIAKDANDTAIDLAKIKAKADEDLLKQQTASQLALLQAQTKQAKDLIETQAKYSTPLTTTQPLPTTTITSKPIAAKKISSKKKKKKKAKKKRKSLNKRKKKRRKR